MGVEFDYNDLDEITEIRVGENIFDTFESYARFAMKDTMKSIFAECKAMKTCLARIEREKQTEASMNHKIRQCYITLRRLCQLYYKFYQDLEKLKIPEHAWNVPLVKKAEKSIVVLDHAIYKFKAKGNLDVKKFREEVSHQYNIIEEVLKQFKSMDEGEYVEMRMKEEMKTEEA